MMLKDNLYNIVAKHSLDEHNVAYELRLNADCEIYKAHFRASQSLPECASYK